MSDNIPDFNLPKLQTLALSTNQLSGNIPNLKLPLLQELYLDNNLLKGSIPASIGNLTNLKGLFLFVNKLNDTIPSSLKMLTNLEHLYLNDNQLSGNIPSYLNSLTKLKAIHLNNNKFVLAPAFTNLKLIDAPYFGEALNVRQNKLTFKDILPNLNVKATATYYYAPQDSIYKDTTIKIIPNTPLSISLGIDSTVTTNSYQWYKNGKEFGAATSSNTLTINALTFEHAGVYTCTVSNPNAPNLKLYSRPITLTTGRTDTKMIETTITPNGDGKNDALDFPDANLEGHPENSIEIYNRWGQLVYKAAPYKRDWSGQGMNGQLLPAGDYFFIMRVNIGDGQIIVGSVYVSRP